MGASLVILAFGCVASFFLRVVLRFAFILRNVTAALAAATGVNGVAQTASSMACFWLVSPSARRCSYAAARAPRAEVLTLGAAAALLLPVVCSPDAVAGSNSCSLRLVCRARGGGVPGGSFGRVPKLPPARANSGGARQNGAGPDGGALVIVGCGEVWAIVKIGRGWVSQQSDKTRQKAAKFTS